MADKKAKTIDVLEMTNEIRKMLTEHTRLLLDQYKTIKGLYSTPNKSIMDMMLEFWPEGTKKNFKAFDMWLEQELRIFEKNIDEFVEGYTKEISELKIIAPSPGVYRQMVDEHTKLWIENYQKLKERREEISQESIESLKKMLPPPVYPMLETANRWVMEQNERFEEEFLKSVRKLALDLDSDKD